MGIVLSGGTIVTAVDCYRADVRLAGEKIIAIGNDHLAGPGDQVISVDGCYLLPGAIDPHTHFDMPAGSFTTADDFVSGTAAAVVGGTTTIIDHITQEKGESLFNALAKWQAKAGGKSYTDYGFHMGITDYHGQVPEEMAALVQQEGLTSFKLYTAYKRLRVNDGEIFQTLQHCKELGALACFHCENGDVIDVLIQQAKEQGCTGPISHPLTRPSATEQEATSRVIMLAELAGTPIYIVHLSCASALQEVVAAKTRGVEVYAETCPQYLLLDDSCYAGEGFEGAKYVMSPPLRKPRDQAALWLGLKTGALDTIGTDHCSFNFKGQKEIGLGDFSKIPGGAPGVEHRLGLLYTYGVGTGKISMQQLVAITATNSAKLFGLYPRKGTLAVGSDADIVVWDPRPSYIIRAANQTQRVDYTPFEGWQQQGRAEQVFIRGQQVVDRGKLCPEEPKGQYLLRKPFQFRSIT
ncbi:dihydropyrimidinase [Desulfotomaculum sp. 1211_IL3151]|uniref:dihydropyrimidinase n=1 Tax=Desulfotomaculum sp. 1211_IL3151 TaxID=3084055 RepID=UPI002FD9FE74